MKKLLAVTLAVIMALSCCVVAFAADIKCGLFGSTFSTDEALQEHLKVCPKATTASSGNSEPNICPYCSRQFFDEVEYDNHIQICADQLRFGQDDFSMAAVLDRLISVFETNASWWDAIEDVIIRLVDFIENIGTLFVPESDVAGAVADLENKVDLLGIGGTVLETIKNLINTLKQKIKDFYCHETETAEETEAEAPADTGSSSIGITVFAAVSVAAAAAFVCTRKKED